ncbi:MAG: hypothetical protein LBR95_06865 [Azoarcus sp.]|jgi:hypothetical protein|nr:hypothetical protein [Azoarcus sp.]
MEHPLSDFRRGDVLAALSEVFLDEDIDYVTVAKRVADIDLAQLKEIFFNEVAPYCGPNLMTVAPPVWGGFDRQKLLEEIDAMHKRNQNSFIANLRHKGFVAFCRFYFRNDWNEVATAFQSLPKQ